MDLQAKKEEMKPAEAKLLAEIHSLKLKNILLELRMKRMEAHFEQVLHHVKFPVDMLQWGLQPFVRISYTLTRVKKSL